MGTFTKIPQNTFSELQLDAGVLLSAFNPASPTLVDDNIICATTGGISISCTPEFTDMGEDVDNCPVNMMELKKINSWACSIGFTALTMNADMVKLSLGAYAEGNATPSPISPKKDLDQSAFSDLWWVGDKSDGGIVAVKLINALSTGGFSLQTTKNGKGQLSVEFTGHVSIEAQDTMPIEFYVVDGEPPEPPAPHLTFSPISVAILEEQFSSSDVFTNADEDSLSCTISPTGYVVVSATAGGTIEISKNEEADWEEVYEHAPYTVTANATIDGVSATGTFQIKKG